MESLFISIQLSSLCSLFQIDKYLHHGTICTKPHDPMSMTAEWTWQHTMENNILKEGEWIQTSGRNKIIRSSFYSIPHSVDEIIDYAFKNMSESSIDRIGRLALILNS